MRVVGHSARQITGEEASLLAWSQIILGAKGITYWWGANADSLTQIEHVRVRGFISPGIAAGLVRPDVVRYSTDSLGVTSQHSIARPPAGSAEQRTQWLHEQPARSESAGPDWLDSTDPSGLYQLLSSANQTSLSSVLQSLYGSSTPGQFYLGWLSVRSALQEVGAVCSASASALAGLHLQAWHVRGFTTWTSGDTTALANVLNVAGIRTRHPLLPTAWDAPDETFVEVSLLADSLGSYVLGVLNRRCNPHDVRARVQSATTFLTYEGLRRSVEESDQPALRYQQQGARMVLLPLEASLFANGARYRITALGREDISLELDEPTAIMLPLRPGEGILLSIDQVR